MYCIDHHFKEYVNKTNGNPPKLTKGQGVVTSKGTKQTKGQVDDTTDGMSVCISLKNNIFDEFKVLPTRDIIGH